MARKGGNVRVLTWLASHKRVHIVIAVLIAIRTLCLFGGQVTQLDKAIQSTSFVTESTKR